MTRDKKCPKCGGKIIRVDHYDSYACRDCDRWLSEPCKAKDCIYCADLRETPRPSKAPQWVWDDPMNT